MLAPAQGFPRRLRQDLEHGSLPSPLWDEAWLQWELGCLEDILGLSLSIGTAIQEWFMNETSLTPQLSGMCLCLVPYCWTILIIRLHRLLARINGYGPRRCQGCTLAISGTNRLIWHFHNQSETSRINLSNLSSHESTAKKRF